MLYFIEGITCGGKSTLAKKLVSENGWIMAKERTPKPPSECGNMIERQEYVFSKFLEQFEEARETGSTVIADFSPWGCVCFDRALARYLSEEKDKAALIDQADRHEALLNEKLIEWNDSVKMLDFLSITADECLRRLKHRARKGDNEWDPKFIEVLVEEYNNYFLNPAVAGKLRR